jgi:hypothetical protein
VSVEEAEAYMHRMRSAARRSFAAAWIAYRWRGAPEPSIPDGMRSHEARQLVTKLGGFRPKGGRS